jgi:hypothetical protein
MMRAMPGLPPAFTAPVGDSISPQGSSGTKVLADYAARSAKEKALPSPQPSPTTGEGEKEASPVVGEVARSAGEGLSPREIGGREGPEPTRFGDWEKSGRCIDF